MSLSGMSASLSWNKAPMWGLPDFYYWQAVAALLMWGAVSDDWTGLLFTIVVGPRQYCHSRVRVPWDSWPYFTVSDSGLLFSSPPRIQVKVTLSVSQSVSKSWCRAQSGAHGQKFITLWQLLSCFSWAPSMTRGWVRLLYMLLALASIIYLGSESLGTSDNILLSQIWDFPFRRLLRLAMSRWRYSSPLLHGSRTSQSQSYFTTGGLPPIFFILTPGPLRLTAKFFCLS
jgi:hypothetical protein